MPGVSESLVRHTSLEVSDTKPNIELFCNKHFHKMGNKIYASGSFNFVNTWRYNWSLCIYMEFSIISPWLMSGVNRQKREK